MTQRPYRDAPPVKGAVDAMNEANVREIAAQRLALRDQEDRSAAVRLAIGQSLESSDDEPFKLLTKHAEGGVEIVKPATDYIATISAGFKDPKTGYPSVSRDGTIYLLDPEQRAAGLREALEANRYRRLLITFTWDRPQAFISQFLAEYTRTELKVYGDGDSLTEIVVTGEGKQAKGRHERYYAGSAEYERLRERVTPVYFVYFHLSRIDDDGPYIPLRDGLLPYRLRTTSPNSIRNLISAVDEMKRYTGSQVAGMPFELSLTYPDKTGPLGQRFKPPIWKFIPKGKDEAALSSRNFRRIVDAAFNQAAELRSAGHLALPAATSPLSNALSDSIAIPDEEAFELLNAGGRCDAEYYRSRWFGLVVGTSLDSQEARRTFIQTYSAGKYSSLSKLLIEATNYEADKLIEAAENVIAAGRVQRDAREYDRLMVDEDDPRYQAAKAPPMEGVTAFVDDEANAVLSMHPAEWSEVSLETLARLKEMGKLTGYFNVEWVDQAAGKARLLRLDGSPDEDLVAMAEAEDDDQGPVDQPLL